MKKYIVALLSFLIAFNAQAQKVKVVSFAEQPFDLTAKLENVLDRNSQPCALIRVAVASENVSFKGLIVREPVYSKGEWLVFVPAGARSLKIAVEGCLILDYHFDLSVKGLHSYQLVLELPDTSRHKVKKVHTVLMPAFSIGNEQFSYGLMAGVLVKNSGVYVRAKTDFHSPVTHFECNEEGKSPSGGKLWLTGESYRARWSVTGGYMQRIYKPFYLYLGAGYGEKVLAWVCSDGKLAKLKDYSYKGPEVELGTFFRFGMFSFSIGVQTNSFQSIEADLGIGITF